MLPQRNPRRDQRDSREQIGRSVLNLREDQSSAHRERERAERRQAEQCCSRERASLPPIVGMVARRQLRRGIALLLCMAAAGILLLGWKVTEHPLRIKLNVTSLPLAKQESWKLVKSPWNDTAQETRQHVQPSSQENSVAQRFKDRLIRLHRACTLYHNTSVFRHKPANVHLLPPYRPLMNVSVHYCSIAKTATTTWTHYVSSIKRHMENIKVRGSEDLSTADDEVYFTFVREPYGRMLSGYVDKLLTPNTLFWRIAGRVTVRLFRKNATEKSLRCGHDTTFPEFVKYVVYSQMYGEYLNGHFIPTHDHCHMCTLPYRYIGHLETIKEDMLHIIKAIQSPVNYTASYDSDTIVQNAKMVLWKARIKNVLKCMDLDEASRRLWKKFQIRGLISKTEKFPFRRGGAVNITLSRFIRIAIAAHQRSKSNPHLKQQRVEALREAFAQVPLADRLDAQQTLFLDFQMFGFDPLLEDVFPKTPYVPDKSFSYFKIYD